ncbi:MAG: 4-hydroxy-tetrahydrodipicolinate reductase [Deltaproteobacteria bacterium]|nr:4-hydroxy-tetrahydrodipicolinate reductase [Deltaproteobacteria bacterium]
MTNKLGILVAGANGRMGKNIIRMVVEDPKTMLVGATDHPESSVQGADAGLNAGTQVASVTISPDLERSLQKAHGAVIIDFSSPETTVKNVERAKEFKTPLVIGTTGFSEEQREFILNAAESLPIVLTPNMSVGMNLVFEMVEQAARILNDDYDIEVFEAHHRRKKDSPSGTANKLAQIICEATGRDYPEDLCFERNGIVGERTKKEIGMQVLRGGDIVGEHTVFFCGEGERIEIKHVANRRTTFAAGAIRAAKWVATQKPGLYTMKNVLGLA